MIRVTATLLLLCAMLLSGVNAAAVSSKTAYRIDVIKNQNIVIIYGQDADGNYTKVVKTFICTTGNGTPIGTFAISDKYRWRALYANDAHTKLCYGQYACRYADGCLFHSVPYNEQTKNSLMYREYNKLGTTASHGCIRLTVADAKWLYENCPSGTVVRVYETDQFVVTKPGHILISSSNPNRGWDPTDPDPKNPWPAVAVTTIPTQTTAAATQAPEPVKEVPKVAPISETIQVGAFPANLDICYLTDKTGNTSSYCSLRGLAAALDGTFAQFNVTWDSGKNEICLTSGVPYSDRNGTEGSLPFSGLQPYQTGANKLLVNGQAVNLPAIQLNDSHGGAYTFVKLRDLCTAMGLQVTWSQTEGIGIYNGSASDTVSGTDTSAAGEITGTEDAGDAANAGLINTDGED